MLTAIRAQLQLFVKKRTMLEKTIKAIQEVAIALEKGAAPDAVLLRRIIEVIEMQQNTEEWTKQYDLLIQRKKEHLQTLSGDKRTALTNEWAALFAETVKILNDDPLGPAAQALADRWLNLLHKSTGVDPSTIPGGVASLPAPPSADPRVWQFMQRALAGR